MPPFLSPSSLAVPISWPPSPPCRKSNVHVCIPQTISISLCVREREVSGSRVDHVFDVFQVCSSLCYLKRVVGR